MADDTEERVADLLDAVETQLGALEDGEADRSEVVASLRDVAGEADDLLADADPGDLLAAVGGEPDPEDPPETLLAAVEQSDGEAFAALRELVTLAKFADADDDAGDLLTELQSIEDAGDGDADGRPSGDADREDDGTAAGGDADGADDAGDGDEDREADDTRDGDEDREADDAGEGDDSDESTVLGEALSDALGEAREGLSAVRADVESAADDDASGPAGDGDERGGSDGGDEAHGGGEAHGDAETGGGAGRSSPGGGTMYSTMPSRDRPDMRARRRLSTVRGKSRTGSGSGSEPGSGSEREREQESQEG